MKLEFLKNINEFNDHVMRLFEFDTAQASLFRDTVEQMASGKKKSVDLTSLPFIVNVNCTMTLRVAAVDEGIITTDQQHFFCDLTAISYAHMKNLLEPFCRKESKGYQLLYELDNPIEFLFSPNGTW